MQKVPVAVERASSSDAFGLLGLPAQFALDPAVIEQAFFERSKEVHPDTYSRAAAAERVAALSQMRALNDAYETLRKPVARAEHLLERAGVTIGDNERLEPEMIMQVLELREELSEARQGNDRPKLEELQAQMQTRRTQALAELPPLFDANDLPN